jgi:hypothetical protein
MSAAKPVRLVAGLGFLIATLAVSATMSAGPVPSAAASSSAAASAASVQRPPPPEPLEAQAIPATPSARPTLDEWKSATQIEPTRRSREARRCRLYRVREWLKVKCDAMTAGIRQQGGSPEGVFLWVGPKSDYGWVEDNGGELILPMRPGDRRVLQFFRLVPEMCFGIASSPGIILDETWIEGDKGPTLVLR